MDYVAETVYEIMWSEKKTVRSGNVQTISEEGSSVVTAADSIAGRGKIFLYSTGSTQPPIQGVPGGLKR
jgi:hypothetical protein